MDAGATELAAEPPSGHGPCCQRAAARASSDSLAESKERLGATTSFAPATGTGIGLAIVTQAAILRVRRDGALAERDRFIHVTQLEIRGDHVAEL